MVVMIDLGAFSVWKSGAVIPLDDYVGFCLDHPEADYFVNLDVIPNGQPTEDDCRQGWRNYLGLCKVLPPEKVIPVYHMGEHVKWLRRYMEAGHGYVGLGVDIQASVTRKRNWFESIKSELFDGDVPRVKLHGFGVTTFDLMRFWRWHSVDSTTWLQHGIVYQVLVPKSTRGVPDYRADPLTVSVSPRPAKGKLWYKGQPPMVRAFIDSHLRTLGLTVGDVEKFTPDDGILLEGEQWYDKRKAVAMRTLVRGVSNNAEDRMKCNANFFRCIVPFYPLDHIYLAGACGGPVHDDVTDHLVSYNDLKSRSGKRYQGLLKLLGRVQA